MQNLKQYANLFLNKSLSHIKKLSIAITNEITERVTEIYTRIFKKANLESNLLADVSDCCNSICF